MRLVIVAQVVDHFAKIEVGHGTDADEMAEADILTSAHVQDGAADGAALGERATLPGGRMRRKTGVEVGVGTENPHAVGPEIANAAGLGRRLDVGFDLLALFPHFLAAGGNDDGTPGILAWPHSRMTSGTP